MGKRFTFTGRDGRRRREGGSEKEEGIIDGEEGETKQAGNMEYGGTGPMSWERGLPCSHYFTLRTTEYIELLQYACS